MTIMQRWISRILAVPYSAFRVLLRRNRKLERENKFLRKRLARAQVQNTILRTWYETEKSLKERAQGERDEYKEMIDALETYAQSTGGQN